MNKHVLSFTLVIALAFNFSSQFAIAAGEELPSPQNGRSLATVFVDQKSLESQEDGSSERPFRTIEGALNMAADNADIYVRSGEYYETLYLVDPVRLHGAGETTQLIASKGKTAAITFHTSGLIEGFRIFFSGDPSQEDNPPLGIWVLDPAIRVEIRNNTFENLMSGIEANSSADVIIENNQFLGNYHGLAASSNPGKVTAKGNRMENGVFGILCSECDMELQDNTITGNETGFMLAIRNPDYPPYVVVLQGNRITNNKKRGIWLHQAGLVANASIDLGGGGRSKGGNTIGQNGEFDVLNQSNAVINAQGNIWLSQKLSDASDAKKIVIQ